MMFPKGKAAHSMTGAIPNVFGMAPVIEWAIRQTSVFVLVEKEVVVARVVRPDILDAFVEFAVVV